MNELIEFLTSKEIIVVYIVAAVACVLCFIIYLIDKNYYKRKQRHNTRELNKLVEEVNEIVEQEEVTSYEEPVLSPIMEEQPTLIVTEEPALEIAQQTAEVEEPVELQPIEIKEEIVENKIEENVVVENIEPEVEIIEPVNVEDLILSSMTEEQPEILKVENIEPAVEEIEQQEELQYTTVEPNRQQAQEELMRLTEELEKAEQEQAKTINLTAYEEEQEENAIISLEELVRKSKEMYESNEITQYADEGNEPISLEDLERRMNAVKADIASLEEEPVLTSIETIEPVVEQTTVESLVEELEPEKLVLDDFNTINIEEPKETVQEVKVEPAKPLYQSFQRTPVISPIYGIEKKETPSDIELENTANYDKLDEEIKKTNEFLMTLRELQKNLD